MLGLASPTRASPRLQKSSGSAAYTFNIYVTAGVKHPSIAEGPVYTLHEVSSKANLHAIKKMIREQIPDVCLKAGIFWLPKKGKQCHTLCTDIDLNTAKEEYTQDGTVKNLRLAVAVISGKKQSHFKCYVFFLSYPYFVRLVKYMYVLIFKELFLIFGV